jgi:geranylgeranyl diphosphate synthase type I
MGKASPYVYGHFKEYSLRDGKRIRSLLFIISYLGYGKNPAPDHLSSAVSFELIQSFILAHDDIVDRSASRRCKPTLHKKIENDIRGSSRFEGRDVAMVIGDIMFALGVKAFLSVKEDPARKEKALHYLLSSASYTGCGEINELRHGNSKISGISLNDILKVYDQKTGNYTFTTPLLMGAALAGAPKKEMTTLSALGKTLGRAFQIYDDLIDIFGNERSSGKTGFTDLKESKKTFLVRLAYENSNAKVKKEIDAILRAQNIGKKEQDKLKLIMTKSNVKIKAQTVIDGLVKKAEELIGQLKMKKRSKRMLLSMIDEIFV